MKRCWWCEGDPVYMAYHDEVWGREERDDRALFKMLTLEAFQSGLAWITILRKEAAFDKAFAAWDIEAVSRFDDSDRARLLSDKGIVRNRKKIDAAIHNAGLCLDLIEEHGGLFPYFIQFKPENRPVPRGGYTRETLPLLIDEAHVMSKTLKKRGFKFTGPMVCMSFMQAVGIINDHVSGCDLCIY